MQDVARIEAVTVAGASALAVTWTDGTTSVADLAGWIARGGRRFAALGNALVFAGAAVGLYGGNVTWDDDEGDLAIDAEHLRMIADHQAPFGAGEAVRWQADMGVSNAEVADLVGVSLSTWSSYKAGAAIPTTVARLCRAMRSEPAALTAHLRPRVAGNPGGGPVYADPEQSARLRWREGNRTVTGADCTLRSAVVAFYGLEAEKQANASIHLVDDGRVHKAAAVRRMHLAGNGTADWLWDGVDQPD